VLKLVARSCDLNTAGVHTERIGVVGHTLERTDAVGNFTCVVHPNNVWL